MMQISRETVQVCIPIGREWGFIFPHNFTRICYQLYFAFLIGVKWNLKVVLILIVYPQWLRMVKSFWVIFLDIFISSGENSLFRYLTHLKKNDSFFSGPVFVCYLCILDKNPIFYVRCTADKFCGLLLHLIYCILGCVDAFFLWDPTCQLFYSWAITVLFRKIHNVLSYPMSCTLLSVLF